MVCVSSRGICRQFIRHTHEVWGHYGVTKCTDKISELCYFPNLRRCVSQILKKCAICQRAKPSNVSKLTELHPIITKAPLEMVSLDIAGPYPRAKGGVRYVVALYDIFTKYVKLHAIRATTASSIIKRIEDDYLRRIGKPMVLLTDNATYFVGRKWKQFMTTQGIKHIFVSYFHPEASPVERVFKEFNRFIRTYAYNKHSRWIEYVTPFLQLVNNLTHSSTGELMFSNKQDDEWASPIPKLHTTDVTLQDKIKQAVITLEKSAEHRRKIYNKTLKKVTHFFEGQRVLLRTHPKSTKIGKLNKKWQLLYSGPYVITKIPYPGTYRLAYERTGKDKGLHPHKDLRAFYE